MSHYDCKFCGAGPLEAHDNACGMSHGIPDSLQPTARPEAKEKAMMEQNLAGLISKAVAAKMTPEFIEKEVDKRVGKLVEDSVEQALRSYSDAGKLIQKAVQDALKVDRLDLPSYGHIISGMLKTQIEAKCSDLIAGQLAQDMDELLHLAPAEMKLSKIAEWMIEHRIGSEDWGEVITVHVEHSDYGYAMVYLDEGSHYSAYDAKRNARHSIHVSKDGKVIGASCDGRGLNNAKHIGKSYGLGQMIRAWVACGTVIILDEDDVVVSVGDYWP